MKRKAQLICSVAVICTISGEIFAHDPVFFNGYTPPTEHFKVKSEKSEPKVKTKFRERKHLLKEVFQRAVEKRKIVAQKMSSHLRDYNVTIIAANPEKDRKINFFDYNYIVEKALIGLEELQIAD